MSSRSSHKHKKGSKGSSNSSPVVTLWSDWDWNENRQQWQSYRTNSRGETETKFRSGEAAPGKSISGSPVPRYDDTLPLNTVSEDTPQYSNNNNYTIGNDNVEALSNSLATATLNSRADRDDPPIAAELRKNNTSTEHEDFDPNYRVHNAREFKFGRVFKVLWSEPTGNACGGTVHSMRVRHGQPIYAKVRRFVIIDSRKGHCLCLPIMSYEGRATTKPGLHAQEHAIIHTTRDARLVENEDGTRMIYQPVRMIPDSTRHSLDEASRINYAKVYTVEYNVKVWFIGRVDRGSESTVKESYDQANPPLSLSSQTSAPISYQTGNPTYNSTSYNMPGDSSKTSTYPSASGYRNTIPRPTPPYDRRYNSGSGAVSGSGNSGAYGGHSSARQPPPTHHTQPSYPPNQYPPSYPPNQYQPSQYAPSQYPSSQYSTPQYPAYAPNTSQQYSYDPDPEHGSGSGGGQ